MSNVTPRPGAPVHPTRQQLDELEALMQRMLALPVNQLEDEPPAEIPLLVPGLEVRDPQEPEPMAADAASSPAESVADEAAPPAAQPPAEPSSRPIAATVPLPRLMTEPSRAERRTPWGVMPIVWINRVFDSQTARLGRPGRWLRSRQGRALLGALGLLFLIAAIGWTILGLVGWTW
jgi:hypothetical protein